MQILGICRSFANSPRNSLIIRAKMFALLFSDAKTSTINNFVSWKFAYESKVRTADLLVRQTEKNTNPSYIKLQLTQFTTVDAEKGESPVWFKWLSQNSSLRWHLAILFVIFIDSITFSWTHLKFGVHTQN